MLSGCGYRAIFETALDPVPVRTGNVITIRKVPPTNPTASTLVINWFGTSSYELRQGNISVLTDPFVTYKYPHHVLSVNPFINYMRSDPLLVQSRYGQINPPPTSIFIGHSHYDHMMDTVAALKLPNWNNIPVYGSTTTKNILAGYSKNISTVPPNLCQASTGTPTVRKWSENWCHSDTNGSWKNVHVNLLYYQTFEAEHAYHFAGKTLWDGVQPTELTYPPRITNDFKAGETYIHFFKFETLTGASNETFTVGIVGAATGVDAVLDTQLRTFAINNQVDVLILCVPGWDNIQGEKYPGNLLEILKPRVIVLTHYDNFFDPDRNVDPQRLVPTADFNEFLDKLQRDINAITGYTQFESILIPGVGTKLYLNKQPGGPINVSKLFNFGDSTPDLISPVLN
jgi:L-ascorbate metabolism protein UlaG (beta-lactamase superfamily)